MHFYNRILHHLHIQTSAKVWSLISCVNPNRSTRVEQCSFDCNWVVLHLFTFMIKVSFTLKVLNCLFNHLSINKKERKSVKILFHHSLLLHSV